MARHGPIDRSRFQTVDDTFGYPDDPHVSGDADRGWRYFWRQRGIEPPPTVSRYHVGAFDLPGLKGSGGLPDATEEES